MTDLFPTVADLAESGYVFRIQDNGGASADRYTVVFSDGDYLALSAYPSHPSHGVSLWGENINPQFLADWQEEGEAVDLALGDLPAGLADHVRGRINEGWRDFLESLEAREPSAAAPLREKAERHQGLYDDGGKGIYVVGEGFAIRTDNSFPDNAAGDLGPFMTAREALARTLPDDSSLAGPEYGSTVDTGRLEPCEEVAAAVQALAHKVGAKDSGWTVRQVAYGVAGGENWCAVAPDGTESEAVADEAAAWALAESD